MRDLTRDIVRGLTVLEMETVNLTNTCLNHASIEDKSITYADTVFPTFTFLSGMSYTPWRRSACLVGLGLAYNSISVIYRGNSFQPRFLGVLQRTGLSSLLFNAGVSPNSDIRYFGYPVVATGLWTIVSTLLADDSSHPFADPSTSAQTKIDTFVFSSHSLYKKEYDPEGLLGCVMTSVTMWLGSWYISSKLSPIESLLTGGSLASLGILLSKAFPQYVPISKPYWSPTFTLVAGGYSIVKYSLIELAIPYLPDFISYGLECLGRRSIEVYFSSAILHSILHKFGVDSFVKSKLAKYIGERGSDLAYVSLSNAFMILAAVQFVEHGIRLRF
ncbi:hypothetical protein AWJ20_2369 [Sugiyamaella lignohabitans]|uniref:Uncharacterized protein n=1 Tax=Sugiyamaella lignohabitans TaxID=796027 RepID=A0A167F305_9ASCO|nr:uncharacterized protein AWJ20_2369 [Sugiyamaella lignohabitans]ANB14762.1 hypothetical protein AWJ20_2369 [Sugiyamaella lignohabitans]